jgi:hypothetical protein
VWRGVPAGAICHNRRQVLDMLTARMEERFESTEALELTAGETPSCSASAHPPAGRRR